MTRCLPLSSAFRPWLKIYFRSLSNTPRRSFEQGALAADGAIVAGLGVQQLAEIGRHGAIAEREAVNLHRLDTAPGIAQRADFELRVRGQGESLLRRSLPQHPEH